MADDKPTGPGTQMVKALKESIRAIVEKHGRDIKTDTVLDELRKKYPTANYNRSTVALLLTEVLDEPSGS